MITLMAAAIGGGITSAIVLSPFSVALGLLAAPFGGSICAALAGAYIAHRSSDDRFDLDAQTDDMVAALRGVTAEAAQVDQADTLGAEGGKPRAATIKAA